MKQPEMIGPYRIERELGRGGMGIVYAGVHTQVGRTAAIKVLLHADKGEARFWRECEALGKLQHPGIVQVYEAGVHGKHPYLALEFVAGKSLQDNLNEVGPWDSQRTAQLGLSLCEAMAHVHGLGMLHRDLKPENVLLDTEGRAKVTDFGLVRGIGVESLTKTGVMVGTPSYMPPEQAGGEKEKVCAASDVYSLGATLFATLTGEPPFRGDSPYSTVALVFTTPAPAPSSLVSGVDPALEDVILRCLSKQPENRYVDAAALGEALRSLLAGELSAKRRVPRGLIPGLVALVLLLVMIGALLVARASHKNSTPTPTAPTVTTAKAGAAWRKAKRVRTSEGYRTWLEEFAEVAEAGHLREARERLAKLSWEELGGPGPEAGEADAQDWRRYRGVSGWLEVHGPHAPKSLVEKARLVSQPWAANKDAPVLLTLTLSPPSPGEKRIDAQPLTLADGRVLLYGRGIVPTKVWDPAAGKLGPIDLGVPAGRIISAQRDGETVCLVGDGRVVRWTPDGVQRAPLNVVGALGALPIGEGTLLYGSLKSGAGAYAFYPSGLSTIAEVVSAPAIVRTAVVNRARTRVWIAGGETQIDDVDWFLIEIEFGADGATIPGEAIGIRASARHIRLSPSEDRLVVGMNRYETSLYLMSQLKAEPLRLSPLLKEEQETKADTLLGTESVDSLFLEGGLLVAYESLADGGGFLAFYPNADIGPSAIDASTRSRDTIHPAWRRDLPTSPRNLALSADGAFFYVGSDIGKVLVIPTPSTK